MFTFVFNPKANRETLRDFNLRVSEFCADNAVVNLDATAVGNNLIIQGTTADDMDVDNVPTLTATVRTLDPDDSDIEEQLDGLIEQEIKKHQPEGPGDPNLPIRFIFAHNDKRSWVVVVCINGVAEEDEKGDDGDGGDDRSPDADPQPAGAAPSQGFRG